MPEDRVERFRREAEATSKLDHSNICTIHEAGEVDGVWNIASGVLVLDSGARKYKYHAGFIRQQE